MVTKTSNRKPHNVNAGYVASRKYNGAYIVIYKAEEAGIDVSGKYAVVCEKHSCMTGATSVPKARQIMKCPDFCEKCFPEETEMNFAEAAQEATHVSDLDQRWYQCDRYSQEWECGDWEDD